MTGNGEWGIGHGEWGMGNGGLPPEKMGNGKFFEFSRLTLIFYFYSSLPILQTAHSPFPDSLNYPLPIPWFTKCSPHSTMYITNSPCFELSIPLYHMFLLSPFFFKLLMKDILFHRNWKIHTLESINNYVLCVYFSKVVHCIKNNTFVSLFWSWSKNSLPPKMAGNGEWGIGNGESGLKWGMQ